MDDSVDGGTAWEYHFFGIAELVDLLGGMGGLIFTSFSVESIE
jgi:hypothetical protein